MITNKQLEQLFDAYKASSENLLHIKGRDVYDGDKIVKKNYVRTYKRPSLLEMGKDPAKVIGMSTSMANIPWELASLFFTGESINTRKKRRVDEENARRIARNNKKAMQVDAFVRDELNKREKIKNDYIPSDSYSLYKR